MIQDEIATAQYNAELTEWLRSTKNKEFREIKKLTKEYSGNSLKLLRTLTRKFYGEINRLTFSFPVYMIFVHKGAGRGYGGNKSGQFTSATGGKRITDRKSMGRMGTHLRQPKPWFNPIVEQEFPKLQDIVATYKARVILKSIQKVLIK